MKGDLIKHQEIWEIIVEQARSLLVERRDEANLIKLRAYHELGELILEHKSKLEISPYGENWLPRLAEDIGISSSSLYDAVSFAQKCPDLESFIKSQPKILTWSKVRKQWLVSGKIEECDHKAGKITVCRTCRKIL